MGFFDKNSLDNMKIIRLEWEDAKQDNGVLTISSFTRIGDFHISWDAGIENACDFTLASSVKDSCGSSTNECRTLDDAKELAQDIFEDAVWWCLELDEAKR